MKRELLLACFGLATMAGSAQVTLEQKLANIDWKEDTTEIVTIDDIIKMQQEVTLRTNTKKHFEKVWGYRSYVNLTYNMAKLSPSDPIPTGIGTETVPDFKSNWGGALQVGRSYRLHKTPIANVAQFCLDYTGIDLSLNHYKKDADGKNLYDSRQKWDVKDRSGNTVKGPYYYIPWRLEKYELDYGMRLGPSITLAPFTLTDSKVLQFIKLNAYFHMGYQVSASLLVNDGKADVSQEPEDLGDDEVWAEEADHEKMEGGAKFQWGHGFYTAMGANLSWKFIGIGYELRNSKLGLKSADTKNYGDVSYDFKMNFSRVYLQIRF